MNGCIIVVSMWSTSILTRAGMRLTNAWKRTKALREQSRSRTCGRERGTEEGVKEGVKDGSELAEARRLVAGTREGDARALPAGQVDA